MTRETYTLNPTPHSLNRRPFDSWIEARCFMQALLARDASLARQGLSATSNRGDESACRWRTVAALLAALDVFRPERSQVRVNYVCQRALKTTRVNSVCQRALKTTLGQGEVGRAAAADYSQVQKGVLELLECAFEKDPACTCEEQRRRRANVLKKAVDTLLPIIRGKARRSLPFAASGSQRPRSCACTLSNTSTQMQPRVPALGSQRPPDLPAHRRAGSRRTGTVRFLSLRSQKRHPRCHVCATVALSRIHALTRSLMFSLSIYLSHFPSVHPSLLPPFLPRVHLLSLFLPPSYPPSLPLSLALSLSRSLSRSIPLTLALLPVFSLEHAIEETKSGVASSLCAMIAHRSSMS